MQSKLARITERVVTTIALTVIIGALATLFIGKAHAGEQPSAFLQNQTTFRDSRGSTTGTPTTASQGTTTFRDAGGRTTGTAAAGSGHYIRVFRLSSRLRFFAIGPCL
jgi:hypothetical protein